MDKKIPMIAILNVDYDKAVDGGTKTMGEHLENSMEKLRSNGVELIDYTTADKNSNYEWERYLGYLCQWIVNHSDDEYAQMSPCCFDEWKDNEDLTIKVKLNDLGYDLYATWWTNYCKENDSLGGNSTEGNFVEGYCIVDNKDYIKTIADECGWLLLAYEDNVFNILDEWAEDTDETEKICGGFTIPEIRKELLKYVEMI